MSNFFFFLSKSLLKNFVANNSILSYCTLPAFAITYMINAVVVTPAKHADSLHMETLSYANALISSIFACTDEWNSSPGSLLSEA